MGESFLLRLGEVAASISDTHPCEREQLVFLNTSDILLGKVLHREYSPVENWPGQAKKSIQKDDILFSEIRPANGRWAFIDFDAHDFVVSTKLMVIRAQPDKILPRYLYHFLTSANVTSWLQHLAESRSGTFPQITFDQVGELEIALPSLPVQAAITSFIDTIDDKIDLNGQMNETLEAMARALFKSWFVDFDPVRAKAEGRQPAHMDANTAALFPDAFDDEGKPVGWRISQIGDVVRVAGGSTPSTKEPAYWEGGTIHWATPKDLSGLASPVLLDTGRRITEAGLAKISSGLLPVGTVLLSSRAPVGYLVIAEVPTAVNQGFIAMVCDDGLPNLYVLFWCLENMDVIESNAGGTTFQEISKRNFRPLPVIVPNQPVLDAFSNVARPLYEKIVSNLKEAGVLADIRDTLLPKLMSGQIRVGDTEPRIEAPA